MGTSPDRSAEERELVARLEELMLPHVAWVAAPTAEALAASEARRPMAEEDVKAWSHCIAALTLCDGGSIADALREARKARAALRNPDPPAPEDVAGRARSILREETSALVRSWLGALEAWALHEGGKLSRASLDAAMLPPLPRPVAAAFTDACQARLLGLEGVRDVLMLGNLSLEEPDLRLPHDAVAVLRLRGVDVVA